MEFMTEYSNPMDRSYHANAAGYFGEFGGPEPNIESPIRISEIGQSVPEGARFGNFIQGVQGAIRRGAGVVELATSMGGGQETVGAEAYGIEAREALRDLAKVNQIKIVSVHSPPNIGNLSGYNPQERSFSDEYRKMELDEVKKAIEFSADTAGRGAVVVHTGEFQRDMSDQEWAKNEDGSYKFLSFNEEPHRQVLYLVDDRNGKVISEVRKSMVVHEPAFKRRYDPQQQRERWVDKEGNFLDETNSDDLFRRVPDWDDDNTRFKTTRLTWDDFKKRAEEWNHFHKKEDGRKWTPEELFMRSQMETRIMQARGSSLFHGRNYDEHVRAKEDLTKLREYFHNVEEQIPPEEQWKIMEHMHGKYGYLRTEMLTKYGPKRDILPTQAIDEEIKKLDLDMKFIHEASGSADAQAMETEESLNHIIPVESYGKMKSAESYAEAGIYAMEQSHNNKHAKGDIFIAPENIFPEMGYGSHPEEMIELVKTGRKKMVEYLTERMINDPHGGRDENGNYIKVPNPYYSGMSKEEAEKEAKSHIKATFDTQHLGMWWKHFQAKEGETRDERRQRFNKWYMEQIDRLSEEDIIGHIHIVDSLGGGHNHLPVGQGDLPVKDALEYLKKKGYKGTMISEAYGEDGMFGEGRILTETWRAFGSPIKSTGFGISAPSSSWTDVRYSYFGRGKTPYFIFGSYSPSEDWQLWSQVPME